MSAPTTTATIASTYSTTAACLPTASFYSARQSGARPANRQNAAASRVASAETHAAAANRTASGWFAGPCAWGDQAGFPLAAVQLASLLFFPAWLIVLWSLVTGVTLIVRTTWPSIPEPQPAAVLT